MQTSHQAVGGVRSVAASDRLRLLPAYNFDTRHLPQRLQYLAWRDNVARFVEVDPIDGPVAGFVARQTAWNLGGVVLTRTAIPAIRFRRTLRHIRSDGLDHWVFSAQHHGTVRTVVGGRIAITIPGTLNVRWLGRESEGETSAMEAVHLFVPRDLCRDAAAVLDDPASAEIKTGLGQLLADYLCDLDRRLPELTPDELPGLVQGLRSMILACAVPNADRLHEAHRTIETTMLERARQLVQRRLFSPTLGATELCRELGVSRSRLYRMFEPLGGVVHYIRSRRLMDAHAALANADDRRAIVEIAAERGFVEAAAFSRAFKREFGYRPTDARSYSNVRPLRPPPGEQRDRSENFSTLLRRLQ